MKIGWFVAAILLGWSLAGACGGSPPMSPAEVTQPECQRRGGRCQSPDLKCADGFQWAGYELCGDVPNNSCCLPDAGG